MKTRAILLALIIAIALAPLALAGPGLSQPFTPSALELLRQDADGELEITWNPLTDTPSFIRGHIALAAGGSDAQAKAADVALAFVQRYAGLFGVKDVAGELLVAEEDTDALGIRHVTLAQIHRGVRVYGGSLKVHLDAHGRVIAASSGFVPAIDLPGTQPRIPAAGALAAARKALPGGVLVSGPQLVVYPGQREMPGATARLAWLVELRADALPARNLYVVSAVDGTVLAVLDRLYLQGAGSGTAPPAASLELLVPGQAHSLTYNAYHGTILPGTLVRSDAQGPVGDQDTDRAHDAAGATYGYFWNLDERDSFDGAGAALITTVHYGVAYQNAYWDGAQTVFGDGFPVTDVVAHEWTHAVTEHSANLAYVWQSGALNESFSDIFGAMVDRDDWLMGEDLPPALLGGREAIRDMANPARFGQPAHTSDWVATCSDNEGVHTNSGIPNKAYYNIATAIGKDKAERIFYNALTYYLDVNSGLEDARAAALTAAEAAHGSGSAEYNAVRDGFAAVGLDGEWNPPANDCVCAASTLLADETVYSDPAAVLEVAATLYRTRVELLSETATGKHYRTLYERHTGRISYLLLLNPSLRSTAGRILQAVTPGLSSLMDGQGDQAVVSRELVDGLLAFLRRLAREDRARGGGKLADSIEREIGRLNWDALVGMTFAQAWEYIQARINAPPVVIYVPIFLRHR